MILSNDGHHLARMHAINAGLGAAEAEKVIAALADAGLLVSADHAEPTADDLFGDYSTLGAAYLHGRIKARWVMCAETHKALWERYNSSRYAVPDDQMSWTRFFDAAVEPSPEVVGYTVCTVMERNRRWTDGGMLFGMPIRIDPAARRPMFEIEERA